MNWRLKLARWLVDDGSPPLAVVIEYPLWRAQEQALADERRKVALLIEEHDG